MPTRKLADLFVERVKPPTRGRVEYLTLPFLDLLCASPKTEARAGARSIASMAGCDDSRSGPILQSSPPRPGAMPPRRSTRCGRASTPPRKSAHGATSARQRRKHSAPWRGTISSCTTGAPAIFGNCFDRRGYCADFATSVWARLGLRDRERHRLAARRASGEDLMVRVDQLNQHLVLAGR